MERPRADKSIQFLVGPNFETVTTFHPEYQRLDPYAAGLPRNVTSNDDEFIEIAQRLRDQFSSGLAKGLVNDEIGGVGVESGTMRDFDRNPMLANIYSQKTRRDIELARLQFAVQHYSFTISPNGIGIFRNILEFHFLGGKTDFSVLNQRYMDGGDLASLRMISELILRK